jgi:Tfp pilus assembly protein PilF
MNRCLVLAVLMAAVLGCPRQAGAQEDRYVQIYSLIQEGDALLTLSQPAAALLKYQDAQAQLEHFQIAFPNWNANVVNFRLNYLADKIGQIAPKKAVPAAPSPAPVAPVPPTRAPAAAQLSVAPSPAAATPPAPPATPQPNPEVESLRSQVRQLQFDNSGLQAKLKEAFAAQPASIDPRELTAAREQIRNLQKENALLKVNLAQRQSAPVPAPPDTKALEQLKHDLTEANGRLRQQTEQADALAREKKELQARVDSLITASWNATNLDAARKALVEANRKLAEQTNAMAKLGREKEELQSRVSALSTENSSLIALRAENELLKKLAAARPAPASAGNPAANHELAEARAQIAALQSDREIWRLEKMALENRVRDLTSPTTAPPAIAPYNPAEESAQVKRLERERDDLQKKLDAAQKELYGRNRRTAAARIDELSGQLTVLRARLGVLEAQAVPYTPEELALFSKPETHVVAGAGQKPLQSLGANEAVLVAQAQKDFSENRFDLAEEKYQEVLRHDDRNVNALTDLATIEMRQDHFGEAEQHLKQALVLAPENVYSLSRLGLLKFQQDKIDEALDALSHAAKNDPKDPEIENFLGLALSRKGLRGPAETALRKAIQLDPNYGDAHNNLAVIYVTQKPPLVELARWHYQKALGAGHAHNPELEKILDQKTAEAQ